MHILVSNDDGYAAKGLEVLVAALRDIAEVTVFAPEANHSGASSSLTLSRPLTMRQASNGFYVVNGTPSDCVHMALTSGVMASPPDLVVSGINNGANLGDDTLYSGTVAAASEGFLFGLSGIAFSLVEKGWKHIDDAGRVAQQIVKHYLQQPLAEAPVLLNVNIPSCPYDAITRFAVTRTGRRHPSLPVVPDVTPFGENVYWIGPMGPVADASSDTDFHAVQHSAVSITPLSIDLTHHAQRDSLGTWAKTL